MEVKPIPQEWRDVLKQIRRVFPGAIIAGGALRDLFNDREIKDVDIFIPIAKHMAYGNPEHIDGEAYTRIWDMFAGVEIELDKATSYGVKVKEDQDRDLYGIFKMRKEYKYDLILCTPEACNMESFDINICQIKYDGDTVHTSYAYGEAVRTRTLRVMNINRTDRNKPRLARLHQKYPDFAVEET
jgi:hypothetical protein